MDDEERRAAAIKRIKGKRDFKRHAVTYVVINALLMGIWAFSGSGYFWPGWVMLAWGVGLAFHGWNAYFEKPISEAEIRRELERGN